MTEEEMTALAEQVEAQLGVENKNFILDKFDDETMEDFLEWADSAGDQKVVYLNTAGGHMHVCNVIVDKINESPNKFHIKMYGSVISAGMYLIIHSKCTVEDITEQMNDYCIYLYHNAFIDFSGRPKKHARDHYTKMLNDRNQQAYRDIKPHLTKPQIKQMETYYKYQYHPLMKYFVNDDIYLDLDQIKNIIGDRYVSSK